MADHQDRRAARGAKLRHQVENLGLYRDVERRRRLVGDEQVGIAGHRHRDHHALAHAAGELVREILGAALGRGHAHARQRLDGAPLRVSPVCALVQHEHLGNLPADGRERVQGAHRLLEDHGDAAAAQLLRLRGREIADLAPLEADVAARDEEGRAQQAHQ